MIDVSKEVIFWRWDRARGFARGFGVGLGDFEGGFWGRGRRNLWRCLRFGLFRDFWGFWKDFEW